MLGSKAKDKKARTTTIDTLIGKSSVIRGDLIFSGSLHIEGTIVGNVSAENNNAEATLVLNEDGRIEGDIECANIICNGTVVGDIHSSNHAELLPKANIKGTLYYNLIEMAVGAAVNGNLVHRSGSEEKQATNIEYLEKIQSQ